MSQPVPTPLPDQMQHTQPPGDQSPGRSKRVNEHEDLLGKGFQLAYFIVPDRAIAVQILGNAMSKLKVQHSREIKRAYWRDKYLKRKITRVVRDSGDVLQWLIYFEAEEYEKRQEQSGRPTACDMAVRFIKYLIQMTAAMSAFYVNVGLQRLLHNYSTSEARQIYEWVTQHYPGDQEYRKVKAALLNRLQTRFNDFIRTSVARHGELRFETWENQEPWIDLVDQCLKTFTPWSTGPACRLLANLSAESECLPYPFSSPTNGSPNKDETESYRCHVFIEPSCYRQLAQRLGLASPHHRLAVPRFFLNGEGDDKDQSGLMTTREAPALTQDERKTIEERLKMEAGRRQRFAPESVRIMADGTECARLDSSDGTKRQCQIREGAKLIEIWGENQAEKLLLAIHWVEYSEWQGIAQSAATVNLGNGKELLLEIIPEVQPEGTLPDAVLWLQCRPVSRWVAWWESLKSTSFWFQSLPKYALVTLALIGVGWILGMFRSNRELSLQQDTVRHLREELAREKETLASLQRSLEIEREAASIQTYALIPDESRAQRGGTGAREPVVSISSRASQVILELPVTEGQRTSYRAILKPFFENRAILTESFPSTAQRKQNGMLKFVLPAVFVEDGKHYVVTLDSVDSQGAVEGMHAFTFYVMKK